MMRLFMNTCVKRGCDYPTRSGFRFCGRPDCGQEGKEGEEE